MTDVVPGEEAAGQRGPAPARAVTPLRAGVALAALGVVYGDIGTSPLYAMRSVFSIGDGAVRPTPGDVYGVVSMVFWSITLVVSVKYVVVVLRADDRGEGGVLALAGLVRRALAGASRRRRAAVMALGVAGAALFFGDSTITPAISVLSAVEGLEVSSPGLAHVVVPVAVVVLTLLFAVQRWGTHRVGTAFGPVMLVWFAALGVAGLVEVVARPGILRGLSPTYALGFVVAHPGTAVVAMGAVVLAITGAEALYADMGQFGRPAIRRAWFAVVFPALTLNYLAQGSLVLRDPAARANPFFLLLPSWAQLPMVVLATAATVIAAQAVIAGAFSVSRQAVALGYLPPLRIRHTSASEEGQVYVPGVNWGLFAAVLTVTLVFRASDRLATAYGVAVTGTFLITTGLLLVVARRRWRWPTWRLVAFGVVVGTVELTYFGANLTKVTHGGWLTLLVAAVVFTVMTTWHRGRELVTAQRTALEGSLSDFLHEVRAGTVLRVPGTAVFPHATEGTVPLALRANLRHNHVLHERVVVLTGRTATVAHVPWSDRFTVSHLGEGIVHVTADFGFADRHDLPALLRRATAREDGGAPVDPDGVSWFLSRITLRRTRRPGLGAWRTGLFVVLARNAASPAEALHLPEERTVVMGAQVDI